METQTPLLERDPAFERLHAEKLLVAEMFAHSKMADCMTPDELAGFPHWLFFASTADVRELRRHLELEREFQEK